jgi:hypothetical protein
MVVVLISVSTRRSTTWVVVVLFFELSSAFAGV